MSTVVTRARFFNYLKPLTSGGQTRTASWGFAPPAPPGLRPSARASRSHPASPGVSLRCTPRTSCSPANRGPQRGLSGPHVLAPPPSSNPTSTKLVTYRSMKGRRPTLFACKSPLRATNALPSPLPLPAGKGSESPSVVRGAGRAALRLLLLPPAGERWSVPRASRVRFALRGGPCPRLRLRAAPATPTALDPLST